MFTVLEGLAFEAAQRIPVALEGVERMEADDVLRTEIERVIAQQRGETHRLGRAV